MTKNRKEATEHISVESLDKLERYELGGQELVKWLEHLEVCAECRDRMHKPSVKQIIERLQADELESEGSKIEVDPQTQQSDLVDNYKV